MADTVNGLPILPKITCGWFKTPAQICSHTDVPVCVNYETDEYLCDFAPYLKAVQAIINGRQIAVDGRMRASTR
ncbi:MAG: hypothetical protein HY543_04635 [Deltaproteobacteria bacterium]|nr:hypothetical protein [Deltaproteobacteria bacterium]